MSANPSAAIAEAITEDMGTWRPGNGMDLYYLLVELPSVFKALHDALKGILEQVSEEQGLPGWFTASSDELLKSIAATADQAVHMDEEFHRAYEFFLTTKTRQRRRRR